MEKVSLSKVPCFNNMITLNRLNDFMFERKDVMPHEIAIATGCSIEYSTSVLMILQMKDLAEGYLLVYHRQDNDPRPYIMKRKLLDGIPILPMVCDICGEEISDIKDIYFDLSFKIISDIEFYI